MALYMGFNGDLEGPTKSPFNGDLEGLFLPPFKGGGGRVLMIMVSWVSMRWTVAW